MKTLACAYSPQKRWKIKEICQENNRLKSAVIPVPCHLKVQQVVDCVISFGENFEQLRSYSFSTAHLSDHETNKKFEPKVQILETF